eukprot:14410491-Alexandrium_andersonii.AAC.1
MRRNGRRWQPTLVNTVFLSSSLRGGPARRRPGSLEGQIGIGGTSPAFPAAGCSRSWDGRPALGRRGASRH